MKRPQSLERQLALLERELRALRTATPRWVYVTPIFPADEPDDYFASETYPAFEDPWENIAGREATAFRLVRGDLALRFACTGGEGIPGSLIYTLPAAYRPTAARRLFGQVGTDGEGLGAIDVNTDGTVVFVSQITSFV